jgi:hypothetical protein
MMTRRCAGRAGARSTWSRQGDCLVSSGTCTASGNSRIRRQRQACCGRAIGHPDRRRHRSSERASISRAHRNGVRCSRIGHRWYSLRSVVPDPWKEGDNPHDLARSATRKSLIRNRVFQNDETKNNGNLRYLLRCRFLVAPASRRRFFRPFNTVAIRNSNPAISKAPSPLLSLSRSARMNGRS